MAGRKKQDETPVGATSEAPAGGDVAAPGVSGEATQAEAPAWAPRPGEQVMQSVVRQGAQLSDGMRLQGDREVEYVVRNGVRTICGPAGLRPALLLGAPMP
jgi:hypothetical protein